MASAADARKRNPVIIKTESRLRKMEKSNVTASRVDVIGSDFLVLFHFEEVRVCLSKF